MTYQYLLTPTAAFDYENAVEWYAERSRSVALRFIKSFDTIMIKICMHPNRFVSKYKNFREAYLQTFPYSIIYFVDDSKKTVIITAVYHQKRNPKNKYPE